MPVTLQYQTFSASIPASGHNWGSNDADNIAPQTDSVLKSWVAACNANANNATKQITVLRDINSALVPATSRGWVLRLLNTASIGFVASFLAVATGDATSDRWEYRIMNGTTGNLGWTDNTANNGYGTFTSVLGSALTNTQWLSYSSKGGTAKDYIIAYSTDNAQEFFSFNWRHNPGDTSLTGGFLIFKDNNNNWITVATQGNGTTYGVATVANNFYTPVNILSTPVFNNTRLGRVVFFPTVTTGVIPATGASIDIGANGENIPDPYILAAHPQLLMTDTNTTRFNFGGELIANARSFYGIHRYYYVVEI